MKTALKWIKYGFLILLWKIERIASYQTEVLLPAEPNH